MMNMPTVGFFVTCLADLFRPSVAFSAIQLLEQAGCQVVVPINQTCCGQPAYNSGDKQTAQAIARQVITLFEPYPYVVAPSGSCAGMLRLHYPQLFEDDPEWLGKAQNFAQRCYELTSFLTDVCQFSAVNAHFPHKVTYHDSCAGLRELTIKTQPRQLLNAVTDLNLVEMAETEICCGFGGTFCVKYPDISTRMVDDKIAQIKATQAEVLLAGDLGCLLNICGRLKRLNEPVRVYHVAEVLANQASQIPALGEDV